MISPRVIYSAKYEDIIGLVYEQYPGWSQRTNEVPNRVLLSQRKSRIPKSGEGDVILLVSKHSDQNISMKCKVCHRQIISLTLPMHITQHHTRYSSDSDPNYLLSPPVVRVTEKQQYVELKEYSNFLEENRNKEVKYWISWSLLGFWPLLLLESKLQGSQIRTIHLTRTTSSTQTEQDQVAVTLPWISEKILPAP
jgi:hypothetical protein